MSDPLKKKRPDVSSRLRKKREIEERTVSCSLPIRLGCGLSDDCRSFLQHEIDQWVMTVSKITHRLTLMFNRLLLYILHRRIPFPPLTDAFFNGLALHGMKKTSKQSKLDFVSLINDFCDNEFNPLYDQYPLIERQRGDCQAILICSSRYKVNFLNSTHTPFFVRQKKYIQVWLEVNGIIFDNRLVRSIQNQINGWVHLKDTNDAMVHEFIFAERGLLGNPDNVSKEFLLKDTRLVMSYYFHILKFYTDTDRGKKFRLAPLCQIKNHFLTIDDVVLRDNLILINVRKKASETKIDFPKWISDHLDRKDMSQSVWKAVFNYDGLRRRRTFSRRVDTDGTRVCFHFQITKKKKQKMRPRERNKKTCNMEPQTNDQKTRVIAIDPGRVNLVMAYDCSEDRYYRLTRGYYYRATGMKALVRKNNLMNLQWKGVFESMSRAPTKSILESDWYRYQQIIRRNYDRLWSFYATEERRRSLFRVKRLKEKCLDRFFNQFRGEKEPVIAYGAATMNPTGKGELSVPVKYVYEKCRQKYKTVKENEKYSTIMHHKCQGVTVAVKKGSEYTRGLRWCPTCSELVSRDKNACKNIGESFGSEERPMYLSDTYERHHRHKVRQIRGCNQTHTR